MPYSAEHKQETRTRILESARRLFNRNGFEAVTIGEIMRDAGLTHGGFYKHFAAKEDLYQAAVLQFICAEEPTRWQARHIDPEEKGPGLVRMIVDAYLSDDHLTDESDRVVVHRPGHLLSHRQPFRPLQSGPVYRGHEDGQVRPGLQRCHIHS